MGRTIPSYRIDSEMGIMMWAPFRKLLDSKTEKSSMKCCLLHIWYSCGHYGSKTCLKSCNPYVNCLWTV